MFDMFLYCYILCQYLLTHQLIKRIDITVSPYQYESNIMENTIFYYIFNIYVIIIIIMYSMYSNHSNVGLFVIK